MRLVIVFAASLLTAWRCGTPALAMRPEATGQATQQNQQTSSPQEGATAQPPQSSSPSAPPAAGSGSENLHAGTVAKPEGNLAKPVAAESGKHRHSHKKAPAAAPSDSGAAKTVVRNGGEADPDLDLSTGLSPQQAATQLNSTNQLLATTDANLKKISGRQLTAVQQDTVQQVRSYTQDARKAAADGDLHRAYNLAVKANLLSAELAGH